MAAVTIMLIMMAAAVPSWRYVMKNDAEEELIFRGGEIADAIARYQARNGNALPPSLEVLVKGKFLRREYKDPMTKDGRWRFIRPGETIGPIRPPGGSTAAGGRTTTTTTTTTTRPSAFTQREPGAPDPRRDPGRGEHQHGREPAGVQRPHEVQRVDLPAGPAAGRGTSRPGRPGVPGTPGAGSARRASRAGPGQPAPLTGPGIRRCPRAGAGSGWRRPGPGPRPGAGARAAGVERLRRERGRGEDLSSSGEGQ